MNKISNHRKRLNKADSKNQSLYNIEQNKSTRTIDVIQKRASKRAWDFIKKEKWALIGFVVSNLLSILISYRAGISKKDIVPIQNSVNQIGMGVDQGFEQLSKGMNQGFMQIEELRQDILKNNDYKKYLDVYQILYKNTLEQLLPGGYVILGIRDNSFIKPENFKNSKIDMNIIGKVSLNGNIFNMDVLLNIKIGISGPYEIMNTTVQHTINNYRIGKLYHSFPFKIDGWHLGIIPLSDDKKNPVFVLGLTKNSL